MKYIWLWKSLELIMTHISSFLFLWISRHLLRYHPIKVRFIRLSVFLFSWQRCSLATILFSCKKEEWEHSTNIFIQFVLNSMKLINTSVLNRLIHDIHPDFRIILFLQNDSFVIYNKVSLRMKSGAASICIKRRICSIIISH